MTETIEERKLRAIRTFLRQINIERRIRIVKVAATKYGMADPEAYWDRIRRCKISDIEIADILESAAADGITPKSIKEAAQKAADFVDQL